jgi:hypothetical protein
MPYGDVGLRGNTSLIPLTAEQARQKALAALLNNNQNAQGNDYQVDPLPKFDYLAKAGDVSNQAAQLNFDSSQNSADNAIKLMQAQQQQQLNALNPLNIGGNAVGGSPRLAAVMRVLRMQESGGNFGAVNKDSGALGGWQIMPSNIKGTGRGWDYEALGKDVSTDQFLNNRSIQRAIVRYKLGQYLKKYGVKGALSAWYSGSPTRWNEQTPQGGYPSVHDYVLQVLDRLR